MTAEDFLESSHKLRVQQQVSREEEEDNADDLEVQEFNNLRQASCWNIKLATNASTSRACYQHVTRSKPRFHGLSLGVGRTETLGTRLEEECVGAKYKLFNSYHFFSFELLLIG